jgi:outer membrane protein W
MILIILLLFFKLNSQNLDNFINLDPFTSFDDHELSLEEENFERFFTFGRFIHIAGYFNLTTPMGPMTSIYLPGYGIGGNISYFIDWNIALLFDLSLNFLPISIMVPSAGNTEKEIHGNAYMSSSHLYLKYYFNFFDISKTISDFNPFLKLGIGIYMLSDRININDTIELLKFSPARTEISPGFVGGLGIEYSIYRKSFLLSLEALYHYTLFNSVNSNIPNNTVFTELLNLDYSGHIFSINLGLIFNLN